MKETIRLIDWGLMPSLAVFQLNFVVNKFYILNSKKQLEVK